MTAKEILDKANQLAEATHGARRYRITEHARGWIVLDSSDPWRWLGPFSMDDALSFARAANAAHLANSTPKPVEAP